MLMECHKIYCEQRLLLVSGVSHPCRPLLPVKLNYFSVSLSFLRLFSLKKLPPFLHWWLQVRGIVQQRISEYAKKEALPSLTRSGCAYLMQVGLIIQFSLVCYCFREFVQAQWQFNSFNLRQKIELLPVPFTCFTKQK